MISHAGQTQRWKTRCNPASRSAGQKWTVLKILEHSSRSVLKSFLECVLTERHQHPVRVERWLRGMNGEDVASNWRILLNLSDGTALWLFSAKNDTQIKQALEFWLTLIRDGDTSPAKNILKKDPFPCIHLCHFIILPEKISSQSQLVK